MARGGSMRGRAAARGAARSASKSSGGSSPSSSGRSAAAGLASLAAARTAKGISASPADLQRYARENAAAQSDLMQMGYSPEFVNQVSTFWQGLAKLPQDQQDKIMSQLQSQANSTVDYGFDNEQKYLQSLRAAKQSNYDSQLALFKKQEADALEKNLGETSRDISGQLQSAYAGLAKNQSFDSGQMGSVASRAIEDYMRKIAQEQNDSKNALDQAAQQRDSASNILSIQGEQDLADVMNRRTAARSQRLSQLLGLNASQNLLAQTPTVNQISLPSATTPVRGRERTPAPTSLPSMDSGGYRSSAYANQLAKMQSNTAARGAARRSKLISNY